MKTRRVPCPVTQKQDILPVECEQVDPVASQFVPFTPANGPEGYESGDPGSTSRLYENIADMEDVAQSEGPVVPPPFVEHHPEYPPIQCLENPYKCPESSEVWAIDGYANSDQTQGE